MRRLAARLLALTLVGAVTVAVAVPALRAWRDRRAGSLELVTPDEEEVASASREVAQRSAGGDGLRRAPLTPEEVRTIHPFRENLTEYDPHQYFRYRPGLSLRRTWPEHPNGAYRLVTNSLGLRQDDELAAERPDLRVLVAGDSHVTGVCANPECFAGRLEVRLAERDPARSVEVINGAHGAYSFYHHLGTLERMVDLGASPDVVVMVVYGGNDFLGVYYWHYFHGTERPARTREEAERLQQAMREVPNAMGQVLNAADYFRRGGPAEVELAERMARVATGEIRRRCEAIGAVLAVVYLPSPYELPQHADLTSVREGARILELSETDLALGAKMADRYLAAIAADGVEVLDLRPVFAAWAGEELLYWRGDLHLSLAGQDLAAEAVLPWIEARSRRPGHPG